MEIGPLRMVEGKKGILTEQQGAWNEYANVLFRASSSWGRNNCVTKFRKLTKQRIWCQNYL